MPRPRLLTKPGTPVPEWTLGREALEALRPRDIPRRPVRRFRLRRLELAGPDLQLIPERITAAHLLRPDIVLRRWWCRPRYRVRKNQRDLSPSEWARFIHAIEALAEPGAATPSYLDFVDLHDTAMSTIAGMAWGPHTMSGHDGRNFLTWHREYLAKLEARLRFINPLVTIPYWNWVDDRAIPAALSDPADLAEWGITRGAFNAGLLPDAAWMSTVMSSGISPADFRAFSSALESPHGRVHNVVGGTMSSSRSPADPIFWLHHAFIDKLWSDWQAANAGVAFDPPNTAEVLQAPPIMTRSVGQILRTTSLGYVYA
jgi:tyrosinase